MLDARVWKRDIDNQLDVVKKAVIFMFEQGKNELLQVRHQLEETIKKEVMLANPMILTAMKNQKGLLELSTIENQLSEPLRQLDKKIAQLDAHIQALKGEDDSN